MSLQGVVEKAQLNAAFRRIANVDIKNKLFFKMFIAYQQRRKQYLTSNFD